MTIRSASFSLSSVFFSAILMAVFAAAGPAEANGAARVVVMCALETAPAGDEVVKILADHLVEFKVKVVKQEVKDLPEDQAGWIAAADQAANSDPSTVVLIGYWCNEALCRLVAVEPRGGGYAELPVNIPKDKEISLAFAVASTARESLLGPLIPEMERIVRLGEHPGPPPPQPTSEWLKQEIKKSETDHVGKTSSNRRLWLEAAYFGDYSHPDGHPIHGPSIGLDLTLTDLVVLKLSSGWMGILEDDVAQGTITTHRLFTALSAGLSLAIGPSRVELAPMGRIDLVFAKADPAASGLKTERRTEVELHMGGAVTWRLPLRWEIEALVGMGALASLISHHYNFGNVEVVPASSLRLMWMLGFSWGLM